MIMHTKLPVARDDYGIYLDILDVDPDANTALVIPYIMATNMLVGDANVRALWEQLDGEVDAQIEYDYHPYIPHNTDPDSPTAGPGQDEHVEVTRVWIRTPEYAQDGGWRDEMQFISHLDAQNATLLLDKLHDKCLADAHKRKADAAEDRSDWNE